MSSPLPAPDARSEPVLEPVPVPDLATQFRRHADWCSDSAVPLYAEFLRGMADDWDAGGVVRSLCERFEGKPPGHAGQLRVLAAVQRFVLRREAPLLATYYRTLGGTAQPPGAWPVLRAVLEEREADIAAQLDRAPQTNEVGRAVPLAVALSVAAARTGLTRVRLLELGASAGLNLRVDRFRITGEGGWTWGPAASPVQLVDTVAQVPGQPDAVLMALQGAPPVTVVERRGCDLDPVEATTEEGRLWLTSFVWPDQLERFRRLQAALQVAAEVPVTLDQAPAGQWLADVLTPTTDGVLTVVWHSVMRQYVPDAEWARVEAEITQARERMPLAHISLEPVFAPFQGNPVVLLDGEVLGTANPHGVPVALGADPQASRRY